MAETRRVSRTLPAGAKRLRPVRANAGVRRQYRKKLAGLVDSMYRSIQYWVEAEWKKQQKRITQYGGEKAEDASPASDMLKAIRKRFRQWRKTFDDAAQEAADWFAAHTMNSVDASVKAAFVAGTGVGVKFQFTRAMNNSFQSIVAENVALIKSIPEKAFSELIGMVMRAVREGRDLGYLSDMIEDRHDVTRRRAEFIAEDQTNKATEALSRVRLNEVGIKKVEWIHVTRSNAARQSHIDMDGKIFNLNEGLYDYSVGRKVFPGELPNCFPPSLKITATPFCEKLFRRRYKGKLTSLITDDGTILYATPNHPILTASGWKAAHLLQRGDYLIKTEHESLLRLGFDKQDIVPTFGNLFEALQFDGVPSSVLDGAAGQFHNDGIENTEVDVIDIDGLLTDKGITETLQKLGELLLPRPIISATACLFSGACSFQEFLRRALSAANGSVGSLCNFLNLFFRGIGKADIIRLASVAGCNAVLQKDTAYNLPRNHIGFGNPFFAFSVCISGADVFIREVVSGLTSHVTGNYNPSFPKVSAQAIGANPKLLLELPKTFTLGYSLCRLVDCASGDYDGHVYNLQTSLGWYITEKTVCSNCRCMCAPVLESVPTENKG